MVKVLNNSFRSHHVDAYRMEYDGKRKMRVKQFSKSYEFPPGTPDGPSETNVLKEDFDKMINKDDFTLGRIYTKEQNKERNEFLKERQILQAKFDEASGPEQERMAEELIMNDKERYLLYNDLPYEA